MKDKNNGRKPHKASTANKQGNIKDKSKDKLPDKAMTGYAKEKKKREDFEAFEDFINYKDFAKATGWKTKDRNEGSKHEGRKQAPMAGNYKWSADDRNQERRIEYKRNPDIKDADLKNSRKRDENKIHPEKSNANKGSTDRGNTDKKNTDKKNTDRNTVSRYADKKTIDRRYSSEEEKYARKPTDKMQPQRIAVQKGACPYLRECGGCNILSRSYEAELDVKQKLVEGLLKKYCKVEPILRMEQPDHYRHKVHVVFDHDRKGNPISGVYEEGTHRVIPVEQCLIHNEKADAIIKTIRGLLKSFKILTYDEDTGYGLLRHVLIRTGYYSKEIMVVLVLGSPILPSKNNFVKALRKEHPEITTVVVNVNDKKTSMVLGEKEQVIYGKGYIEDSLCGKTFRISPKSFYQVNPVQTEKLYHKAIELAGLNNTETVVDAYSGIGTIGLVASDQAKRVIGVELNKEAVKDAIANAKRNQAEHIEFYNNDAGVFLSQMAEQGESVDVVFMDPPRTGSTIQFLDALAKIKPRKVVYISCNPVTLERDLDYLTKKGYKAETAVPVDMFPWTAHVECVVLLSKVQK